MARHNDDKPKKPGRRKLISRSGTKTRTTTTKETLGSRAVKKKKPISKADRKAITGVSAAVGAALTSKVFSHNAHPKDKRFGARSGVAFGTVAGGMAGSMIGDRLSKTRRNRIAKQKAKVKKGQLRYK